MCSHFCVTEILAGSLCSREPPGTEHEGDCCGREDQQLLPGRRAPWLPSGEHERQTGHEGSLTIHFYKDGLLTEFFVGSELTEGEA